MRCSNDAPAAACTPENLAPRSGLTGRSTRPGHLAGRRPDPLHGPGLRVRSDPTANIVYCGNPMVTGLTGDVDRVSARGIVQFS